MIFRARNTFFICVVLLFCVALSGCGSDDGFQISKTSSTSTTTPSAIPTLAQPCSLLTLGQAGAIMSVAAVGVSDPESTIIGKEILRCRYSATSADKRYYLTLNVFVYTTQDSFNLIKKSNHGTDIETNVDAGFTYTRTNEHESERLVAAKKDDKRVAVSTSIALISSSATLSADEITLPSLEALATQVGNILSKV